MPKSKHRKSHTDKVLKYKKNKKIEQELLKKKMIDDFVKKQQDMVANQESHTSTQDVVGPEIDIDGLNEIEEVIETENSIIEGNVVNIDEINEINEISIDDSNNNK